MPAQPSSSVSDRPLHANIWHCFPPASAYGQQSSSLRSTLPAQHVRPSGFFCCWSDGLELTARKQTCGIRSVLWTVTDSHWRRFYFRSTNVFSPLEVAARMCYINLLLTFDNDIAPVWMSVVKMWRKHSLRQQRRFIRTFKMAGTFTSRSAYSAAVHIYL